MTSPAQYIGLFKSKSLYGMSFTIRSSSLQYTARPLRHCTHYTTLRHHYSTALYSLHCTTTTPLNCTHYNALYSLHCTVLTTLHCTHYTALCSQHCNTTTPLHCTHFTACLDPHLIKEAKILSRNKWESFLNNSYIKWFVINLQCTNLDLFIFEYS